MSVLQTFSEQSLHPVAVDRLKRVAAVWGAATELPSALLDDVEQAPVEIRSYLIALQPLLTERQWAALPAAVRGVATHGDLATWQQVVLQEEQEEAKRSAAIQREIQNALAGDFLATMERFRDSPYLQAAATAFVKEWARNSLKTDDGKPLTLDDEQAWAVAADGGDVLVAARAGSGKTRVLVTRAIFLMRHCGLTKGELLLLAFNRDAADEMRGRLKRALGDNVPHVMTFHALAHALVHPEEKIVFDESQAGKRLSRAVQSVIDDLVRGESREAALVRELMLAHFREDWEQIEAGRFNLTMEEFLAHRRSLPRQTLRGDYVKSFGEKLIANTLFEHGLNYEYEASYRWDETNYRPDFKLSDGRGGGVIIEYFGLAGDPDYDEMSDRKRAFWAAPQRKAWTLLEYSSQALAIDGKEAFTARLLSDLTAQGFEPKRLSEEAIWQLVRDRAIGSCTRAMKDFVGRCRKLNLKQDDLAIRVQAHTPLQESEKLFLEVAQSIYRGYLRKLEVDGIEDFDGLMWRAVAVVAGGGTKFVRDRGTQRGDLLNLRYVLVDEFQDFSEMFARLLQEVRAKNPAARFYFVGDDWQAINGFAGADRRYFEEFASRYREPRRCELRTNWRSDVAIVELGNVLMDGLGEPAVPRRGAAEGSASLAWIDDFSPSPFEREQHGDDEITPPMLRLVADFLKRGKDVVILSRRNALSWFVSPTVRNAADGGLLAFQEHLRRFLPPDDRRRVTVSTAHKFKGLQGDAVIVMDAVNGCYPLVHPNWLFFRIFGDSLDRIVEDEQRLFYVALTRARNATVLLSERRRGSPFLRPLGFSLSAMNLSELRPMVPFGVDERVEVRLYGAYDVKDEFDETFKFRAAGGFWYKTFPQKGFDVQKEIMKMGWASAVQRIEVWSASGVRLQAIENEKDDWI